LLAIKAPARGATDTSNVDLFPRVIKTGKFINPFIFSNRADLQNFDATVASTILTNDSANYIVTNDKFNLIENSANALQDKDTFTQSAIPTIS
jgi:hypothetical protein